MNNPIVFVTQDNYNDYAAAEKFGEVHFITKHEYTKIEHSSLNQTVKSDIRRFLSEYHPGVDFILPAGNPMISMLVCINLPKCSHQFLKWNSREYNYTPFKLDLL